MVDVGERETNVDSGPTRHRGKRVARIGAAVVVVLIAIGGAGFWRYAARYAPLMGPFTAGPDPNSTAVRELDTDLGSEYYLRGPAGTQAAWRFTLSNNGRFAVTVTKLEFAFNRSTSWHPWIFTNGGSTLGEDRPWRALPATIPAHASIVIQLVLVKPGCNGGSAEAADGLVHWNALGVHHLYSVNPFGSPDGRFVGCPEHVPGHGS